MVPHDHAVNSQLPIRTTRGCRREGVQWNVRRGLLRKPVLGLTGTDRVIDKVDRGRWVRLKSYGCSTVVRVQQFAMARN